ncbi:SRPBCC family protein [Sporichthya polymorpha]|uniref:SRPBCC family protein n=1 Tax=Sporichthya polymorpha TaxID=35751 RepID=UPI0003666906|nr:SRPBCC family protein [Sporichthya polymorpha]
MTSVRVHTRIAAPADVVWKVVSDAAAVASWVPAIARSSASGSTRQYEIHNGPVIHEEIVTNDQVLRRFQHSIRSGLPIEAHLATIDVLDDRDGSLVVYGADVEPQAAASMMAGLMSEALDGLRRFVEAGA